MRRLALLGVVLVCGGAVGFGIARVTEDEAAVRTVTARVPVAAGCSPAEALELARAAQRQGAATSPAGKRALRELERTVKNRPRGAAACATDVDVLQAP